MKNGSSLLFRFVLVLGVLLSPNPATCQNQQDFRNELATAVAKATHRTVEQVLSEYKESITIVGSVTDQEGIWLTFQLGSRQCLAKYFSVKANFSFSPTKMVMPAPKTVVIGKLIHGGEAVEIPLPDSNSGTIKKERFNIVRTESIPN